jgi:hypothetical protein
MTEPWIPRADEVMMRAEPAAVDEHWMIGYARHPPHRFLLTLLSWWEHRGRDLGATLARELSLQRERLGFYDQLSATFRRDCPGTFEPKGRRIRSLYPAGILRQQADLDLVVPDEAALWRIGSDLLETGWEIGALWVVPGGDRLDFTMVLERPSLEPLTLTPDQVELSTMTGDSDYWKVFPRRMHTDGYQPPVIAAIAMFDETATRRLGARDAYDLLLLLTNVSTLDLGAELHDAAAANDLVRQWRRLHRWLARTRLAELSAALPAPPRGPQPLVAARRFGRRWAARHDPVRTAVLGLAHHLRRSAAAGRRRGSPRARRWLTAVQERMGARRLLDRRVPMFGAALARPEPGEGEAAELLTSGPYAELRTPVGRFAMSAGGDIRGQWLTSTNLHRHWPPAT